MNFHHGKFVWFEHLSQDMARARSFYDALFNWHVAGELIGGRSYAMILNQQGGIGGFKQVPAEAPAHWFCYLSVANVDALADRIIACGGSLLGLPTDYPPVGRGSTFRDCTGAVLSTWHSFQGDRDDLATPAFNDWHWCELMSTDAAAAADFYQEVFGYVATLVEIERVGQYYILYKDEVPRAGILQNPHPETGSFWMPYVLVRDCDACSEKAQQLGGQVIVPAYDVENVGRFAVLVDSAGAALGIVQRHGPLIL